MTRPDTNPLATLDGDWLDKIAGDVKLEFAADERLMAGYRRTAADLANILHAEAERQRREVDAVMAEVAVALDAVPPDSPTRSPW